MYIETKTNAWTELLKGKICRVNKKLIMIMIQKGDCTLCHGSSIDHRAIPFWLKWWSLWRWPFQLHSSIKLLVITNTFSMQNQWLCVIDLWHGITIHWGWWNLNLVIPFERVLFRANAWWSCSKILKPEIITPNQWTLPTSTVGANPLLSLKHSLIIVWCHEPLKLLTTTTIQVQILERRVVQRTKLLHHPHLTASLSSSSHALHACAHVFTSKCVISLLQYTLHVLSLSLNPQLKVFLNLTYHS